MIYTRHILEKMNNGVQRCIICGEIIIDERNAMYHPPRTEPSKGWGEGELYISKSKNPTILTKMVLEPDTIENCQ